MESLVTAVLIYPLTFVVYYKVTFKNMKKYHLLKEY